MASAVGRWEGSFDRQAATRARSEGSRAVRSGCSLSMRLMTAGMESAPKAGRPVAAKTIVTPQAKTSTAGVAATPLSCSGARYDGVPRVSPVAVAPGVSSALAMPKSMTTGPSGPISTLAGLKSRCRMPAPWIAARAVAVLTARRSSAAPLRGPSRSTSWRRDGPGTYSLTM